MDDVLALSFVAAVVLLVMWLAERSLIGAEQRPLDGPDRRRRARSVGVAAAFAAGLLLLTLDYLIGPLVSDAAEPLERIRLLAPFGDDGESRLLFLLAVAVCGPPSDHLVRWVLAITGLPTPESAASSGVKAGRWIGRAERWILLGVIAAAQPALAFIPTAGKAVIRYAEIVADAAEVSAPPRPVAEGRDAEVPPADQTKKQLLEYVLVGSLTSWGVAVLLGLIVHG